MATIFYVGRSYPHAAAIQELKDNGHTLGIFRDTRYSFKHEPLFDYVFDVDFESLEGFREAAADLPDLPTIDGLLCTYENYIIFKAAAGESLGVPSISMESALACTDKYLMRSRFLEYNPSLTPQFTRVTSKDQLRAFAKKAGYPLVLKPTNLMKSLLIHTCNNQDELEAAYDDMTEQLDATYAKVRVTERSPAIIAEQFITGNMCSVAGFVDSNGEVFLADGIAELTTAKQAGFADNFLYSRVLPADIPAEQKERIFATAREGVKALGMTSSPAHIEIIYNDTEVKIVEIGARIGGFRPFLYKQSYGIDLLEQEVNAAIGAPIDVTRDLRQYAAMFEVFPKHTGEFSGISGMKSADNYAYVSGNATHGTLVGPAKHGFRAPLILGTVNSDKQAFLQQCHAIQAITIEVTA